VVINYGCALDSLGEFSGEEEHYELAVQMLTQVFIADPSHYDACYNLGVALTHLGEAVYELEYYNKAIELFSMVTGRDSEDDMAWNEWGMALLTMSDLMEDQTNKSAVETLRDSAKRKLLKAASLGNIASFYNLATLYAISGEYELAVRYLERSAEHGALPPVDEMLSDEWLEKFCSTEIFKEFLRSFPEDITQDGF